MNLRAPLQRIGQMANFVDEHWRHRSSLKVPDYGPKLLVRMEGNAVVDAPQPSTRVHEDVPSFAVGVVDEPVEQGDALHLLVAAVFEVEIVQRGVVYHEELEHA